MGFATDAIHAGQHPDKASGAVVPPLTMSTTFEMEEVDKPKAYDYGRVNNPNREMLEANIAMLEKGNYGVAFGSGVAAIHSVFTLLEPGSHVIATNNLYGGTYRLFNDLMSRQNYETTWVDTSDLENVKKAIKENTKLLFIETPTNPMLTITDLRAAAELARENGIITVVDNTFMSPYFQNPLYFDIDISLHSTSKYINGHSDVIGGIVVTNRHDLAEKLRFYQMAAGNIPSPFDTWLTLRSVKTLAVRMEQHQANSFKVAEYLKQHPKVKNVVYPGLEDHPQHELAKKQMRGFGATIPVELDTLETAVKVCDKVNIFTHASSLGGVESLISHPASLSHHSMPRETRYAFGITDSTLRLSIGLEDAADLIADLDQAIGK